MANFRGRGKKHNASDWQDGGESFGGGSSPYWRWVSRSGTSGEPVEANPDLLPESPLPKLSDEQVLALEAIYEAVERFNLTETRILGMMESGLSQHQMATLLDISQSTVRDKISKIKKEIMKVLEKRRKKSNESDTDNQD